MAKEKMQGLHQHQFSKTDCVAERRTGLDRREFNYAAHVPERRSKKDRRESNPYVLDRALNPAGKWWRGPERVSIPMNTK